MNNKFLLGLIALVLFLNACGDEAVKSGGLLPKADVAFGGTKLSVNKLVLGVIPSESSGKVLSDKKLFADALAKELGVPVEILVGKNYTEVIEALQSGKADIGWLAPFSYILASSPQYNAAEVVASQVKVTGAVSYQSLIVSNPKAGLVNINELKGKRFAFVERTSTSGNVIPRYLMLKSGLDPDKDIVAHFAGNHESVIQEVLAGTSVAGAIASDIYETWLREGKLKESDLTILARSTPIPGSPVVVRKSLAFNDKEIIKLALLGIKDPAALKAANISGLRAEYDDSYDTLRDISKALNLDLTTVP